MQATLYVIGGIALWFALGYLGACCSYGLAIKPPHRGRFYFQNVYADVETDLPPTWLLCLFGLPGLLLGLTDWVRYKGIGFVWYTRKRIFEEWQKEERRIHRIV